MASVAPSAAAGQRFLLAVCGLHLRGQPLNHQLTSLQSTFVRECRSAQEYKLYAFTDAAGRTKPGMVAVTDGSGAAVHLEVWDMPIENFGRFMLQVPPPLGIGTVKLEDGGSVNGFICEAWVAEACRQGDASVEDITHLGSWLPYVERQVARAAGQQG
ncbi:allophanate hydrolase [Micractinium conductrix]|uniref:Allophanate hydrolase n=1 Tax=Micractinium conductrix TaxID=554055 RepID=A0A2P6V6D2_9CHLO|nr:allophanate hydrolase [Micractinium conductrix]|eukprot:PSC69639.1 allophanate hydrolase [Micractinium conductrix]